MRVLDWPFCLVVFVLVWHARSSTKPPTNQSYQSSIIQAVFPDLVEHYMYLLSLQVTVLRSADIPRPLYDTRGPSYKQPIISIRDFCTAAIHHPKVPQQSPITVKQKAKETPSPADTLMQDEVTTHVFASRSSRALHCSGQLHAGIL